MKRYQYQIIRYLHDHFTGEYVNVGIVLYSKENSFLKCKVTGRYKRITDMFPSANGRWILKNLNFIKADIGLISNQLSELFQPADSLDELIQSVWAKDNNAIQLSEVHIGLDIDLDAALEDLFKTQVEKYIQIQGEKESLLDDDVWRLKYKSFFEKYGIENKLSAHTVEIPKDKISFSKSWKNEIWHCYEPLSFVLQEKDSIKDKVYKWAGKIQGLQQSKESLHLTLMTSISSNHTDLKPFIDEYLKLDTEGLKVEIVTDDQAESLALSIKEKMEHHEDN